MVLLSIAVIFFVAGVDLGIKNWVEKHVSRRTDKKIFGDFGILRRVHNKGMMMNLGENHSVVVKWISVIVTMLAIVVQWILLRRPGYLKEKIGMSLLLGGALSNTVDRVKRGYVVDYFAFNSKNKKISRVTYNLGDFAIFAGGILIMLAAIGSEN